MAGTERSRSVPLLFPALSLCLGIFGGGYISEPWFWVTAVFLVIFLSIILLWFRCKSIYIQVTICLAYFFLGGLRSVDAMWYYSDDHIVKYCQSGDRNIATLRGTISTPVRLSTKRGAMARYDTLSGNGSWFDLKCRSILSGKNWVDTCGIVRVYTSEPILELEQGNWIELTGSLYRRSGGDDDFGNYIRSSGIIAGMSVDHNELIKPVQDVSCLPVVFSGLRQKLLAAFNVSELDPGSDSEAITAALLLGERTGIAPRINEAFLKTGTMHYLSLSGLHVSILTGFVWFVLRCLRLPRWIHGLITIGFVVLFLGVVPLCPPIVRAGLVTIVFCLGYISRKSGSSLNLLAFSAIVLLICRPLDLFDAGFQLSFGIVTALLILTPGIMGQVFLDPTKIRLRERYELTLLDDRPWQLRLLSKVRHGLFSALSVSMVAWLVSLGLICWHFNRISWLAPLNSMLLAVPVTVTMLTNILRLVLWFILPAMDCCNVLFDAPAQFMLMVTNALAGIPHSCENVPELPAWVYLVYHINIAAILALAYYRKIAWLKLGFMSLILQIVVVIVLIPVYSKSDSMEVHALGVGHGCCILVKLPGDRVIVYDCGSYDNFNMAASQAVPYFRKQGINHIDALFISHADLDHYNGVPDLVSAIETAEIYAPTGFEKGFTASDEYLVSLLQGQGKELSYLSAGDGFVGEEFCMEVLWPEDGEVSSTNYSSLVLKVVSGGRSVLLCGDITPEVLSRLADSSVVGEVDTLLLPHHGEYSPQLEQLIAKVRPGQAILSSRKLSSQAMLKLETVVPKIHQAEKGSVLLLK